MSFWRDRESQIMDWRPGRTAIALVRVWSREPILQRGCFYEISYSDGYPPDQYRGWALSLPLVGWSLFIGRETPNADSTTGEERT